MQMRRHQLQNHPEIEYAGPNLNASSILKNSLHVMRWSHIELIANTAIDGFLLALDGIIPYILGRVIDVDATIGPS